MRFPQPPTSQPATKRDKTPKVTLNYFIRIPKAHRYLMTSADSFAEGAGNKSWKIAKIRVVVLRSLVDNLCRSSKHSPVSDQRRKEGKTLSCFISRHAGLPCYQRRHACRMCRICIWECPKLRDQARPRASTLADHVEHMNSALHGVSA